MAFGDEERSFRALQKLLGDGWLVKIRLADPAQSAALLDRDAYVELLGQ